MEEILKKRIQEKGNGKQVAKYLVYIWLPFRLELYDFLRFSDMSNKTWINRQKTFFFVGFSIHIFAQNIEFLFQLKVKRERLAFFSFHPLVKGRQKSLIKEKGFYVPRIILRCHLIKFE